jgi:hypothetical protein
MAFKKKLYKLAPGKNKQEVEVQLTKRKRTSIKVSAQSNEHYLREILANKLSGTHVGLWLLVPEYQRMGAWDLLKGCFNEYDNDNLNARLGLQLANESALCANRIREKNALCNRGFSLVNGLSFLATDETIHQLLNGQSVQQYQNTQIALAQIRRLAGHYSSENILAMDPHRIVSSTKRVMVRKKKRPEEPSKKMLQTFFCNDAITGQPIAFTIGSSSQTCSFASKQLFDMLQKVGVKRMLLLADKEHFTKQILEYVAKTNDFDIIIPAPSIKKITHCFEELNYKKKWPGYALAETDYKFSQADFSYRLIVQRTGEVANQYSYAAFLTTSTKASEQLLPQDFPRRWTIEEFFNFEGDMGWNRASTFNLNIRYGRQTMALIAQAATYQLRTKLPKPYRQWTAKHTSEQIFSSMDGDVRVKDDTIIVTYYNDYQKLGLKKHYENLPEKLSREGINPKIPWLYDYKLDFRFK